MRNPVSTGVGILLYVFIYWGMTLWLGLLAASWILYLAGFRQAAISLAVAAVAVSAFHVGLALGEAGVPKGRRR